MVLFVDIGAERGIFLPYNEMLGRPQKNEKIWIKLYRDKSERLAVSMKVENELRKISKPAVGIKKGDLIFGSVYNKTEQGYFIFTQQQNIALLYTTEVVNKPRIGEEITTRVIFIRKDGRLNVTQPFKTRSIDKRYGYGFIYA